MININKDSIIEKMKQEFLSLSDDEQFTNQKLIDVFYRIPFSDETIKALENEENILKDFLQYEMNYLRENKTFIKISNIDLQGICTEYLEQKTNEYINTIIFEKAEKELDDFIEELKTKSKDEIINSAYEINTKQDILMIFENDNFDSEINKFLYENELNNILGFVYKVWQKCDTSQMEDMKIHIESSIEYKYMKNYNNELEIQNMQEENIEEMEM